MTDSTSKKGNWVTFPFIIGTFAGLKLASGGWQSNLIVYLIEEFRLKSIDAVQIYNIVSGCSNLFPIVGAILADSFLGSFLVILVSSCVSLLGMVFLALTAVLHSSRQQPCEHGSNVCETPSKVRLAFLYAAIALCCIGFGGSRFTIATMGANQFDKQEDQAIFFNWYFFIMYVALATGSTAIVYIEDNVSWELGFGLCLAANAIALAIFLSGIRFYRYDKPQGSPFMGLVRVVVASIRKRKALLSSRGEDYYVENHGMAKEEATSTPGKSFRFLNRAALIMEGDIKPEGSIAKPWRLCTVQEVENLKILIRIFPLWSSSIFLATPIGMQSSLTTLQALTMDRNLGKHFKIPAGSMLVVVLISASIFLTFISRFFSALWKKLARKSPTSLQRIGVGHLINVLSMAVSAMVESKRLKVAKAQDQEASSMVSMSVLWVFPQLILVGIGEAFHFPGQVGLYYQEFPDSLRSTATAMIALIFGIAFYLSTLLVHLVRNVTDWLPDDINNGRLDNVYWILVVMGAINFGYYLCCAKLYKYRNAGEV